jgi:hypothetical protein
MVETFTMCPARRGRITGRTARAVLTAPKKLISTFRRNSSSGRLSMYLTLR